MTCNNCTVPGVDTADSDCAAANTCGCGFTSDCGCGNGSAPYYNQASAIQETHCQSVTNILYSASLSCGSAFVMPTCNHEVVINFPSLYQIQIGSYLWNATYGYLLVTGFNQISQQVTAMNECQVANAAPGTVIPRCTLFNVVGPPP